MSLIRSRDTKPELRVRYFLHGNGLRYRLDLKIEGVRPDMVFPGKHTALFVHGCMWHRHPAPSCQLTRTPKSNIAFWSAKFSQNQERDKRQRAILEKAGWNVIVVWECETKDIVRLTELANEIRSIQLTRSKISTPHPPTPWPPPSPRS